MIPRKRLWISFGEPALACPRSGQSATVENTKNECMYAIASPASKAYMPVREE